MKIYRKEVDMRLQIVTHFILNAIGLVGCGEIVAVAGTLITASRCRRLSFLLLLDVVDG